MAGAASGRTKALVDGAVRRVASAFALARDGLASACHYCLVEPASRRCSGCRALQGTAACQRAHWPSHASACGDKHRTDQPAADGETALAVDVLRCLHGAMSKGANGRMAEAASELVSRIAASAPLEHEPHAELQAEFAAVLAFVASHPAVESKAAALRQVTKAVGGRETEGATSAADSHMSAHSSRATTAAPCPAAAAARPSVADHRVDGGGRVRGWRHVQGGDPHARRPGTEEWASGPTDEAPAQFFARIASPALPVPRRFLERLSADGTGSRVGLLREMRARVTCPCLTPT